jgi:hypothetical protein
VEENTMKLDWNKLTERRDEVRKQVLQYCEQHIGAVIDNNSMIVEGENVPLCVDNWGQEGCVTVRVNWSKHGIRSKKDGRLDLAAVAESVKHYVDSEKTRREQNRQYIANQDKIEKFLATLGLQTWSYEKNFSINTDRGHLQMVLNFSADKLEQFKQFVELARWQDK